MNSTENNKRPESGVITQKILRALKGDKSERMELIKSPHKLVRQAVLLNQKITLDEIVLISSYKTTETDILVKISENNEWLKNYKIRYNLVTNSKTPVWIALKLLPTINRKDIRNISKNRNVLYAVRTEALKIGLKP